MPTDQEPGTGPGRQQAGVLSRLRVIELAGIGPGPFCAMLLADHGADVLRIDRPDAGSDGVQLDARFDLMNRGRRSVALDLKRPEAIACVLTLVERADVLIEGYRPGVTERLGLGPDACLNRNPRLVYGRMTGWGQTGPLRDVAGHDINYISLSGVLHSIGPAGGPPVPPLNLVGDLGGGAMFLLAGLLAALYERQHSGRGQVVDASMVEGSAMLMAVFYGLHAAGAWPGARGTNFLDGGAPYYGVYVTQDGGYMAVGAIEERFYRELLERLGIDQASFGNRADSRQWPAMRARIASVFSSRTRDEWCRVFEGSDACVSPVLSMDEAPRHPLNVSRESFVTVDGIVQPAPAPRFSRSTTLTPRPPPGRGEHSLEALRDWGMPEADIDGLQRAGVLIAG